MRRVFLLLLLVAPVTLGAQGSPSVLERGIAAETAGRWQDALSIFRADLERNPRQPDLWVRVADIHARLGQRQDCIAALTQAASVAPKTASIFLKLSEAYAEAGNQKAALAAIEVAVVLSPSSVDYLRRRATLATWNEAYSSAKDSYRRIIQLAPGDAEATVGLARVSAWSGDTDVAVSMYRRYLRIRPDARDVWIELARAEAWRGNFADALDVLAEYRSRFGESGDYTQERIAVLARGGRPREATQLIERLLPTRPDDYALHLSRTVALAAQHRRTDALTAFDTVTQLRPLGPETHDARGLLRVALSSTGAPGGAIYSDSDGLRTWRIDPRMDVALGGDTRFEAGYDRVELRARAASGLERLGGALDARHELTWLGLSQRAGRVTLRGQAGYARLADRDRVAYEVSAQFASDRLQLSGAREYGFLVVSPRTVGLGLTRLTHRLGLDWNPSLRYHLVVEGAYDTFSDGNRRWDVMFAPRRVFARSQRLNLDLGVQVRQFGTTRNLDNGYYDPSRYENYSVVAFPYWKLSENTGIGGVIAVGVQRDETARKFSLAENAALEGTFGIYRDWMVKINGSMTMNDRLVTGAFRGYSGRVVLVRRF